MYLQISFRRSLLYQSANLFQFSFHDSLFSGSSIQIQMYSANQIRRANKSKIRKFSEFSIGSLFSDPHPRFISNKAIGFSFVFVLTQAKTIKPIRMRSFKMKKAKNSNDHDWQIKSTLESAHFSVVH